MSDFEDEFRHRAAAMALLDSGHGEDEYSEAEEQEESDTFGADDLDTANNFRRSMITGDELTQKAALRKNQWHTLNAQAPFSRLQPPSVLKGVLGGQQKVSSDPNVVAGINSSAQVALWGGDDVETMPVSITLAPVQQIFAVDSALAVGSLRPYGIVQFGTRGFLVKVEVDIGRGCQFSVGASYVSVQVALEPVVAPAVGSTMLLSGMLSFLPVSHTTPLTRTKYVDFLAIGAHETILLPAFAKNLAVWRNPLTTEITLSFRDANDINTYSYVIAAGATLLEPIPLSNDIVAVRVTNTGGVLVDHVRLIFGLSL
jgi:hypothetical protein